MHYISILIVRIYCYLHTIYIDSTHDTYAYMIALLLLTMLVFIHYSLVKTAISISVCANMITLVTSNSVH